MWFWPQLAPYDRLRMAMYAIGRTWQLQSTIHERAFCTPLLEGRQPLSNANGANEVAARQDYRSLLVADLPYTTVRFVAKGTKSILAWEKGYVGDGEGKDEAHHLHFTDVSSIGVIDLKNVRPVVCHDVDCR